MRRLLRDICSSGSSFPDPQPSEFKSFRLQIIQTRLALPVSDDVFAPVELQILLLNFYCVALCRACAIT